MQQQATRWSRRTLLAGLTLGLTACSVAGPPPTDPRTSTMPTTPRSTDDPIRELDADLVAAAWADDVDEAGRLIRAGADVNAQDATQQSAFLIAASEGFLDLLELTLDHGADVTALDSFDGTALIRAAERGHADVVGRLLRTEIDVDHVNRLGWTALHEAIWLGRGGADHLATVRALAAGGADLTVASRTDGLTPLQQAEAKAYREIARSLQRWIGADVPNRPDEALRQAAADGDADLAALALRGGADHESRDDRRRSPLLLASAADRVTTARLLVGRGADPDALDDRHDTPWLVTGVTGSVAMLETLLPAGPDLTIRNRFGGVSLIPACERGHVDYVRRVLQTSIEVNHVNDLGWTGLLEAVILGDGSPPYVEIVTLLLDAGADRSIADRDGVTALQHARARGFTAVAAALG